MPEHHSESDSDQRAAANAQRLCIGSGMQIGLGRRLERMRGRADAGGGSEGRRRRRADFSKRRRRQAEEEKEEEEEEEKEMEEKEVNER